MALDSRNRILLCVAWLLAVTAGTAALLIHQNAAGHAGHTPAHWPQGVALTPDRNGPTLVLFAHPQCPCTRATINELNRLLARCPKALAAHVVFLKPGELADDWVRTDLWRSAAAIPNVKVHEDPDGEMMRRFGAETSGHVVLYDPQGRLLFNGGITAGRGHAGDNAGSSVILSLLSGEMATLKRTPVYGCSLLNESQLAKE